MDEETKQRISDYFDAWQLVEYLGKRVSTMDIIDAFEEDISEILDDIEELMEVRE